MELVFGGILFTIGFVLVCRGVLERIEPGPRFFGVMLAVFFVYSCVVAGIIAVASRFGDIGLMIYMVFTVYTIVETVILIRLLKGISKQIEKKNAALFFLYLAMVLTVTIFSREDRGKVVLETNAFAPIIKAVEGKSMSELYHMIMNVVLFVPLGYLFAQMHPKYFGTVLVSMGFGCMLSTVIETCQLVFRLGNCDVGDILANTVGALVGLFLYRWMSRRA